MRYMMLIYIDEKKLTEEQRTACYAESAAYARKLHARGQFISTAPLHPTTTATTIRVRDGKRLVTDGPFAETREQLGGYYMVQAENLDEAIRIAGGIPGGKWGSVEIRPVIEVGGLPEN